MGEQSEPAEEPERLSGSLPGTEPVKYLRGKHPNSQKHQKRGNEDARPSQEKAGEAGQVAAGLVIPESFGSEDERLLFFMEAVQEYPKRGGEDHRLRAFRTWLEESTAAFMKDYAAVSGRVATARAQKAGADPELQGARVGPDGGSKRVVELIDRLTAEMKEKPWEKE